jgi:hypothetical protein
MKKIEEIKRMLLIGDDQLREISRVIASQRICSHK